MEAYSGLAGKKVVVCLPGRVFSNRFLMAWTDFLNVCNRIGIELYISNRYSSNVYFVRSMCLGADVLRGPHQKPFAGKLDYDYIFWIDSDIVFSPTDALKLLVKMEENSDIHILSGLYAMEGGSHFACVKEMSESTFKINGAFEFLQTSDWNTLKDLPPFQVDYNGMGFMVVRSGVYENIEYPWFAPKFFKYNRDTEEGEPTPISDFCSEDVGFCLRAKEAGFPVFLDPSCRVGHEKNVIL